MISIITVVFNARDKLERTIQSVVDQTWQDKEYLVIDGASTDGTLDIVSRHASKIDRVVSEPDKGIFDAMNRGASLARGEWILFMNAGDWFVDNETLARMMDRDLEKVDALYGDCLIRYDDFIAYDKALPSKKIWYRMICSHQSIAVRTGLCRQNPFDWQAFPISADHDLLCWFVANRKRFFQLDFPVASVEAYGNSGKNLLATLREKRQIALKQYAGFKLPLYVFHLFLIPFTVVKGLLKQILPKRLVTSIMSSKFTNITHS